MRCSAQNRLIRLPKYQNVRYKKLICGKIWGMICSVIFRCISYRILSCCILPHCRTTLSYQLSYHIVIPHCRNTSSHCIVVSYCCTNHRTTSLYHTVVLYRCPASSHRIIDRIITSHYRVVLSYCIIALHCISHPISNWMNENKCSL